MSNWSPTMHKTHNMGHLDTIYSQRSREHRLPRLIGASDALNAESFDSDNVQPVQWIMAIGSPNTNQLGCCKGRKELVPVIKKYRWAE